MRGYFNYCTFVQRCINAIEKTGILSNEGVVLAAERRNTNKLLDEVGLSVRIINIDQLDILDEHLII